jgi:putative transposase
VCNQPALQSIRNCDRKGPAYWGICPHAEHKYIGGLMRKHDLRSRKQRAFRIQTADSKHAHPTAPNVLERDSKANAPNQKWLADLTYVPTAEGWLYLVLVKDLFARKVVGWATSPTMPQELTLEALQVALCW